MTRRRLTPEMVAVLLQQLADALRAGLSLRDTLTILSKDTDLPKVQAQFIADAAAAVQETGALSGALEAYASTFPAEAIGLIRTCEQSGQLVSALELVANDHELRATQVLGVKGALSWPIATTTVLIVICAVFMIFVTPSFKQVFTSFGADLPGPTLLVMAVSDLAVDYWYWVLIPVAVLAVVAQRRWARGLRFATLDAALIQIPFVRRYLTKCFVSRLIQVLDRALSGSLPLIPAVAYLRATAGNTRLTGAAGVLEAQLLGGKDLTAAVRDTPSMPGQLATALELGAATQDPGAMLRQLAAFSEGEAARSLMRLQQALIACAYVAAGLIVGFFVIAMYLPIFRMGEAV